VTVESYVGVGPRVEAPVEALPPLGVAEEFLLLRPDGEVASVAPEVLGTVADELRVRPGSTDFQIESTTGTGADLPALARELSIARRALAEAAADQGARLVSLGTAPFTAPGPAAVGDGPRSGRLVAVVPDVTGTEATCGFRIRVQVPSRELGVAVLDRCRGWLPLLLALTANSPLWRGRDTGWSSYRYVVQGRRPPSVPRPRRGDDEDMAGLVASRSALDARSVSSWARLSSGSPAVEFGIADTCSTVADAVLVSGLVRGLTAVALADETAGRPSPELPDRVVAASARAAARWGLRASLADPLAGRTAPAGEVLAALVAMVAPALAAADELPVVTASLQQRLRRGSGADRQRTLHRRGDRQALVQTLANICAGVDH
jgi:carboxylate-amine ligase